MSGVSSVNSSVLANDVRTIYENLTYGPAPEADNVAQVVAVSSCHFRLTIFSRVLFSPVTACLTVYFAMSVCLQAWLDDHGRKFGLFIDNKWVIPIGRKTYETKCPSTGCLIVEHCHFVVAVGDELSLVLVYGPTNRVKG